MLHNIFSIRDISHVFFDKEENDMTFRFGVFHFSENFVSAFPLTKVYDISKITSYLRIYFIFTLAWCINM